MQGAYILLIDSEKENWRLDSFTVYLENVHKLSEPKLDIFSAATWRRKDGTPKLYVTFINTFGSPSLLF